MDDEELTFNQLQESLYRVETGNYEYRLVLRCRQLARVKFSKLRSDVSVKLDLLDQKHGKHFDVKYYYSFRTLFSRTSDIKMITVGVFSNHLSLFLFAFAVQDILCQLQRLIAAICRYNDEAGSEIRELVGLFPFEMDLKEDVFQYKQNPFRRFNSDDQIDDPCGSIINSNKKNSSADDSDQNIIDLN